MWTSPFFLLPAFAVAKTIYNGRIDATVVLPCGSIKTVNAPSEILYEKGSVSLSASSIDFKTSLWSAQATKFSPFQQGYSFQGALANHERHGQNTFWASADNQTAATDFCGRRQLNSILETEGSTISGVLGLENAELEISAMGMIDRSNQYPIFQISFAGVWDSNSDPLPSKGVAPGPGSTSAGSLPSTGATSGFQPSSNASPSSIRRPTRSSQLSHSHLTGGTRTFASVSSTVRPQMSFQEFSSPTTTSVSPEDAHSKGPPYQPPPKSTHHKLSTQDLRPSTTHSSLSSSTSRPSRSTSSTSLSNSHESKSSSATASRSAPSLSPTAALTVLPFVVPASSTSSSLPVSPKPTSPTSTSTHSKTSSTTTAASSSDSSLPLLSSSSSSSSSSNGASNASVPSATAATVMTVPQPSLKPSAIAGIATGCSLAVVVAALAFLVLFLHHRRRKATPPSDHFYPELAYLYDAQPSTSSNTPRSQEGQHMLNGTTAAAEERGRGLHASANPFADSNHIGRETSPFIARNSRSVSPASASDAASDYDGAHYGDGIGGRIPSHIIGRASFGHAPAPLPAATVAPLRINPFRPTAPNPDPARLGELDFGPRIGEAPEMREAMLGGHREGNFF
ncbi:MAG: hypothetical protein M4579_004637 [Chaenotheca gracillima]|nr:MAG: hypothetical protein M4579_004637 [Chaenotheca gracillima]